MISELYIHFLAYAIIRVLYIWRHPGKLFILMYCTFVRVRRMINKIGECFKMRSSWSCGKSSGVIKSNLCKVGCLFWNRIQVDISSFFFFLWICQTDWEVTGKAKIEKTSYDLKVKSGVLESALSMVPHLC